MDKTYEEFLADGLALARAAGGRAEAAGHARRRCRGVGAIFTRRAGDGCVACSSLRAQPPEGVEWLPVFRAEAAEGMTAALI